MRISNFKQIDLREAMADRESVSHLPEVHWHIQTGLYRFPVSRERAMVALSYDFQDTARARIYDLADKAAEYELSEDF